MVQNKAMNLYTASIVPGFYGVFRPVAGHPERNVSNRRSPYRALAAIISVTLATGAFGQSGLPRGQGRAVMERMCMKCHQTDVITGQRLSRERWAAKVDQMISYGALGSDDDVKVLVDYLAQNYGKEGVAKPTVETPSPQPYATSEASPGDHFLQRFQKELTTQYDLPSPTAVTNQSLLHADREPQNWLSFNGTYRSNHYSSLGQITPENVKDVELKWVFQSRSLDAYESTPLVVDGVLYTMEGDNVVALDAATGRLFWIYKNSAASDVRLCCGRVNRGLAILGDTLFLASPDAHLIALDAKTGSLVWSVEVAKVSSGYSLTVAPLIVKNKVIIGIGGGEYGIRGFIAAYDAATGNEVWRFNTTAAPGDPGGNTWGGDSWKRGGGPAWLTGSYDPDLNLLYWGVGNPGPDFNGDVRPGDNLYTCSMLALDPDNGKLKWYYQANPHNEFDWDAVQVPVLVDMKWEGKPRKVLLWADRNGFFYVLDRVTGQFLMAKAFVKQNWNAGFTKEGRPLLTEQAQHTKEGTNIFPDLQGGTNWFSPSYSQRTHLFYLNARDNQSYLFIKANQEYEEGAEYKSEGRPPRTKGTRPIVGMDEDQFTAVRALEPTTGRIKWEFRLDSGVGLATYHDYKAEHGAAGILTTASDLLFTGGRQGNFVALDARDGRLLWSRNLGGALLMNPMTYSVAGRQYVAVNAGTSLFVFGLRDADTIRHHAEAPHGSRTKAADNE